MSIEDGNNSRPTRFSILWPSCFNRTFPVVMTDVICPMHSVSSCHRRSAFLIYFFMMWAISMRRKKNKGFRNILHLWRVTTGFDVRSITFRRRKTNYTTKMSCNIIEIGGDYVWMKKAQISAPLCGDEALKSWNKKREEEKIFNYTFFGSKCYQKRGQLSEF